MLPLTVSSSRSFCKVQKKFEHDSSAKKSPFIYSQCQSNSNVAANSVQLQQQHRTFLSKFFAQSVEKSYTNLSADAKEFLQLATMLTREKITDNDHVDIYVISSAYMIYKNLDNSNNASSTASTADADQQQQLVEKKLEAIRNEFFKAKLVEATPYGTIEFKHELLNISSANGRLTSPRALVSIIEALNANSYLLNTGQKKGWNKSHWNCSWPM